MRLLVHFHIFYLEQVPWFLRKLANIHGVDWDLYVTGREEAMPMLRTIKADAKFLEVENVGYDIWPFISVLRAVDLSRYTHILKIHTKNRAPKFIQLNGIWLPGYRWRNLLVNAVLGSKKRFLKALELSSKGLVCEDLLVKNLSRTNPTDNEMLREEALRIGLDIKGRQFAAGTMFLSRIEPFDVFVSAPVDASLFRGKSATHLSGSPAHVYERLLSLAVTSAKYEIVPVVTKPFASLWKRIIVR